MTALRQDDFLPTGLTIREFLEWTSTVDGRYELVDGDVRAMAPASGTHGLIQSELTFLIRQHLKNTRSPCRLVSEPGIATRIRASKNYRIPELGVTCQPIVAGQNLITDPVLLIEVLSPSNDRDTWNNIWAYTVIPSVREILVLNSTRVEGWLLRRDAKNNWPDEPEHLNGQAQIVLPSINFVVTLLDVYATTHFADVPGATT
jgi:Uma2 family endonuclease